MLNGNQMRYLELLFESQEKLTDSQIAKKIGVAQKTICDWKKNNKEFQDEYDREFRQRMKFAASKAFKKQCALLDSRNDMVAHLAAKDIMDRAGFNPTEKVDVNADLSPIVIKNDVTE